LQFAKVAGEALARADAKVQEAAQRSAAAEEAKAYAARVKAAAAAKRAQEAGASRGSATDLAAMTGGTEGSGGPAGGTSVDAKGLVRQIVAEGDGVGGGALNASALMGATADSAPLRPRLLDDTAAFEPVELGNADANFATEHVVVRPSVAALQEAAAGVVGAREPGEPASTASPPSPAGSGPSGVPPYAPAGATQPVGSAQIIGALLDASQGVTAPVRGIDEGAVTAPFVRTDPADVRSHLGDAITVSETAGMSVAVADVVTVKGGGDVAVVTASPRIVIVETAAPVATEDEPSDGIIRSAIAAPDSAELARRRQIKPPGGPEHDGPPVKQTTGEIGERPRRDEAHDPGLDEPSVLIADIGSVQSDLASAHAAVAAAATASVGAAAVPVDAASASRELEVSDVRRDAVAFSDVEEAFFKTAESHTHSAPKFESFDDLDEGYEPPKFWERVFGKKTKKP
jgi:hypothetical protein